MSHKSQTSINRSQQNSRANEEEEELNVSRTSSKRNTQEVPKSRTSERQSQPAASLNASHNSSYHEANNQTIKSRASSKPNSVKQNGDTTQLSINQRVESQQSIAQNNGAQFGSQASVRSNKSDTLPFIEDTPKRYSQMSNDRDLINKSRNGFIGTGYISDVKEYFEHPSFEGILSETNKKYLEDLLSDFRKLLRTTLDNPEDTLHDIEFIDDRDSTEALPGHSQLLTARSATFEALFKKFNAGKTSYLGFELLESDKPGVQRVLLPSQDPDLTRDLMEASLHYMYWGNIDEKFVENGDKLKKFFEVASFLDLKELRRHLAQELFKNLKAKASGSLSIEYLKLSVKCGCKYLKKETIDYIVRYRASILKGDAWKKFIDEKENKELVKEIYQRMVENSN